MVLDFSMRKCKWTDLLHSLCAFSRTLTKRQAIILTVLHTSFV